MNKEYTLEYLNKDKELRKTCFLAKGYAEAIEHTKKIASNDPDVFVVMNMYENDDTISHQPQSAIEPTHYRKGSIDLYESAYLTRPFNEVRAILEFTAERYIKRDKNDRVEDISKAIYTLERLKEYEMKERENE